MRKIQFDDVIPPPSKTVIRLRRRRTRDDATLIDPEDVRRQVNRGFSAGYVWRGLVVNDSGICDSVRLPRTVLNSSHIHQLKAGTDNYVHEVQKNRKLEDIASNLALDVSYFNLSEYHKSGALLSCVVMHLNRHSYKIALT